MRTQSPRWILFDCRVCRISEAGSSGQVPYRAGGMGVNFFNVALMGKLDPLKPQVLVYEPVGGSCASSRRNISCRCRPRSRNGLSCSAILLTDRWPGIIH